MTDVLKVVINVLFCVLYTMFILFIAGSKMRRLDKKKIFSKLTNLKIHETDLLEWSRQVLKLYNKMKTLKIVLVRPYQKLRIENRMCYKNHFQPVYLHILHLMKHNYIPNTIPIPLQSWMILIYKKFWFCFISRLIKASSKQNELFESDIV